MILKYDRNGEAVRSGEVVEIGGEGRYVSVCRPHWTDGDIGPAARQLWTAGGSGIGPGSLPLQWLRHLPQE